MKKIIYHGSDHVIKRPQYGMGALTNDYGRGFYCTESKELAMEWACSKNTDGYANQYEIEMTGLSILNLNSAEYNILNWLAILAAHRTYWEKSSISEQAKKYLKDNFLLDTKNYDIIIGYRADDSYFSFAQDFVANAISLKQLDNAMHLGQLGEQIVLKSEKAFGRIKFIDSTFAKSEEYFVKKMNRDKLARKEYRKSKEQAADVNDIYMLDIMREGIGNAD